MVVVTQPLKFKMPFFGTNILREKSCSKHRDYTFFVSLPSVFISLTATKVTPDVCVYCGLLLFLQEFFAHKQFSISNQESYNMLLFLPFK